VAPWIIGKYYTLQLRVLKQRTPSEIVTPQIKAPPNPALIIGIVLGQDSVPDDLALRGAAYADNKTLILTVLNKAYAEEDGLLDLFIDHVLFVAMDGPAYQRCRSFNGVRCYRLQLVDGAGDLSSEQLYMSDGFIRMMWRRIRFLGDVLKHGYSFIFSVGRPAGNIHCMQTPAPPC
jgi:hypothetical protein